MEVNIFKKLNSGVWLNAGASDSPEVSAKLQKSADICYEINNTRPSDKGTREALIRSLFGSIGKTFVIHPPFRCDFGFNIHIGENFIGNFNLSILDEAEVLIGNNVMIGPNCSLITITHALEASPRREGLMKANPIKIGDDAWLAANVTVLPGVTIGKGAVIGAGSVVTKDIPDNCVAVGNPCRVIKRINN